MRAAGLVALGLALAPACGGSSAPDAPDGPAPEAPWFEEASAALGLDFVHTAGERRFLFPEIMAGGVGLLDQDGDGRLDVYLVQAGSLDPARRGPGNRLYRNAGERFVDVTDTVGGGDAGYGMGCTCGDFDGDGAVDVYVTNVGSNVLYRNEGARLADTTERARVGHPGWSTSSAFADFDKDGDLDLYVANYLTWSPEAERVCEAGSGRRVYCNPANYGAPAKDALYRNEGDGTFADAGRAAGIEAVFGTGLGVACGDLDGDGWIDVYVANDGMANQLWRNRQDGTFADEAQARGCALSRDGTPQAGMGVVAVDADHDGDLDLYLAHLRHETNVLYENQGAWFEDATARRGLADTSFEHTGFGLAFADFDHDGALDVFMANGRVTYVEPPWPGGADVYSEPNLLMAGAGERFREVAPAGGTDPVLVLNSRGCAKGDLDDDGDLDLVVVNEDHGVSLLCNLAGERGAWIAFDVRDASGRSPLCAPVHVAAGALSLWGRVSAAESYCSSSDVRVHFGLGRAQRAESVIVGWPGGAWEEFGPLQAGRYHALREGAGRPAEKPR